MVRHPHLRGSAGGERPVRVVESSVTPGLQCSIAANTVWDWGGPRMRLGQLQLRRHRMRVAPAGSVARSAQR